LYHSLGPVIFWLVVVNAALYALFTVADVCDIRYALGTLPGADGSAPEITATLTELLKYASICVCLTVSALVTRSVSHGRYSQASGKFPSKKTAEDFPHIRDARLQVVIFAFTLAADFLILFTPNFTVGIAVFCGAHLTALVRYAGAKRAKAMALIALAVAAAAAAIAFMTSPAGSVVRDNLSTLSFGGEETIPWSYAAAASYTLLITTATVYAFKRRQAHMNNILSRLGMTLFLLCDVNVLLWNLRNDAGLTGIPEQTYVLMWTFYLPAQTMLALSAYDFERGNSRSAVFR
jgi:hypothetical protein